VLVKNNPLNKKNNIKWILTLFFSEADTPEIIQEKGVAVFFINMFGCFVKKL